MSKRYIVSHGGVKRYVISDSWIDVGNYVIREQQPPRQIVAIVWSRRLARMIRQSAQLLRPHFDIQCSRCHKDRTLFPGCERVWGEEDEL